MLYTPAEATDLEMRQHFRAEGALLAGLSTAAEETFSELAEKKAHSWRGTEK